MKGLGLLAALLLFVSSPAGSQAPEDKLIVPGVRIGKWALAMTLEDVLRMNGPAIRGRDYLEDTGPDDRAGRGMTSYSWYHLPIVVYTLTGDKQNRIELLWTNFFGPGRSGGSFSTDRGIGFEATREVVLKTYGRPTAETIPSPGHVRVVYDGVGIAFRFDQSGRMTNVAVFRPGRADRYWNLL